MVCRRFDRQWIAGFQFQFHRGANIGVEQAFAKVKALLRRVAAGSVEGLWQAVGEALDAFNPEECASYFRHADYGVD